MLLPLLTIAALLLLGGAGLHAVIASTRLNHFPKLRRFAVGLVFGAILFAIETGKLPGFIDHSIALEAGPLIFAGFIGGPLGALAALACVTVSGLFSAVDHSGISHALLAGFGAGFGWVLFRTQCIEPRLSVLAGLCSLGAIVAMAVVLFEQGRGSAVTTHTLPEQALLALGSLVLTALSATAALKSARNARAIHSFNDRMELASSVAQIGMWEWDVVRNSVVWDSGMHALYKTQPGGTSTPEALMEMVLPEDRARIHSSAEVASLGGAPTMDEFRIRRADGEIRNIRSVLRNEHDSDGKLLRVSGLHMDVTALRAAEEERGDVENKFDSMLANVPGAVLTWEVDARGRDRITYLNSHCEAIFGYSQAEVSQTGSLLWNMIDHDDQQRLRQALMKSMRTMTPMVERCQIETKDGRRIWVEGRAAPTRSRNGGIQASVLVLDVSEQIETQVELIAQKDKAARAERLETVGKLSGGIAHDFNNLLAIIVGNLEILREELYGDTEKLEFVQAGLDASVRGADLVRNMLSFARRARLDPTDQKVAELFARVESWVARVLPATIDVEFETVAAIRNVKTDPSGAENALVNLVLNARDAMPKGGRLSISAKNLTVTRTMTLSRKNPGNDLQPGDYVVISVTDTGHGIAKKDADHIFEPFFTTRAPGQTSGSGLGLSTVHGFMKQSGGAVSVDSIVGKGTTVSLYFPAQAAEVPAPQPIELAPKTTGSNTGVRILLAEDEPQVAQVMRRALELDGYNVTVATSGDVAETLYTDEGPFDMLVTDIVMPGTLQGPDLAETLRFRTPHLPVVFLSGYAPSSVENRGIRPGDTRLMKPVVRADLSTAVADALSSRSGRRDMAGQAHRVASDAP